MSLLRISLGRQESLLDSHRKVCERAKHSRFYLWSNDRSTKCNHRPICNENLEVWEGWKYHVDMEETEDSVLSVREIDDVQERQVFLWFRCDETGNGTYRTEKGNNMETWRHVASWSDSKNSKCVSGNTRLFVNSRNIEHWSGKTRALLILECL